MATRKIDLVFYKTEADNEPVRDWLKGLPKADRRAVGLDLMTAQFAWPVGMPLCRALKKGLFEIRTDLASDRISRVFICHHEGRLVALHACIKKTRKTPKDDMAEARSRLKKVVK